MTLECSRSFRENCTLVRLLDVGFERHQAIFAGLVQKLVKRLERIKIGLLGVLGAPENTADSAGDLLQNVQRIGDEDGADGRPADGDQFRWLNEDAEIS